MTQQVDRSAGGLIRVSVASGSRRVDLVLPAAVPVAELVPELARSVGLLDPATVYGGYRLVTPEGRVLRPDTGLQVQGISDGGLLTVAAGVDDEPARVYDDIVEAMADVVERELTPWRPAVGRRTALAAAALLLGLGAVALLVQHESRLSEVAAVAVALVLGVGAIVLSRAQGEPEAAVTVSHVAAVYAAVAGLLLVPESEVGTPFPYGADFFGYPLAAIGGAVLLSGLVCLIGLGEGRILALPAVVTGAVLGGSGLLLQSSDLVPAELFTSLLVVVVLAGSIFPWLALGSTGTQVDQIFSHADIEAEPRRIDAGVVNADARLAHEILVAVTATVGVLLVLIAPLAVSLGVTGTVVAVVCCIVLMLRTRQYRTGPEVLVGLVSGVVGLFVIGAAVLVLHPSWRPTASVVLAIVGAVLMLLTLVPTSASVRRGRLGDVAETLSLVALLPLTVVAVGIFSGLSSITG